MRNIETDKYTLYIINGQGLHTIIDRKNGMTTPIYKDKNNLELLKDTYSMMPKLFDSICHDIIKGDGVTINHKI